MRLCFLLHGCSILVFSTHPVFEIRKSDTVEISKEICIILFIVKYLIFNAKIGEILYFWAKPLFINFKKEDL